MTRPPDMKVYTTLYETPAADRDKRPHRCDLCEIEHGTHAAWVTDQASHGFVRANECPAECLGVTVYAIVHPDDGRDSPRT